MLPARIIQKISACNERFPAPIRLGLGPTGLILKLNMVLLIPMLLADKANHTPAVTEIRSQIVCSDCSGVKALLFNPEHTKIYSANLEGMSVHEYDRASRKILRKLEFIPTPGRGFNYTTKQWINSYEEKPVELCITRGRYLWISLHNAGGVVVWDLKENSTEADNRLFKEAWLIKADTSASASSYQIGRDSREKVRLLWIKTGTTPKVIAASPDGKYLFVANWHSNTVSVLDIASPDPVDWVKIRDLSVGPIPRGMAVSGDSKTLYVALMGGSSVEIFDLDNFLKADRIEVGINPRHLIIQDRQLFVTLNSSAKLVRVQLDSHQIDRTTTAPTPRTLVSTADGRFLFVTCYTGNCLQMFSADSMTLMGSWVSTGHPVCIDIFQSGANIEAWVGNHTGGTIRVFDLKLN
jgi:6-phosphogluconolactonase (cycloisomerase 2 family)